MEYLKKEPGIHRRPVEILLRNDWIQLLFSRGTTKTLKVVCSGIIAEPKKIFSGYTRYFLNETDDHVLFFRDVKNSWMNEEGLYETLVEAVKAVCEEYDIDHVQTMGTSMGGFAAFLISKDVGAKESVGMAALYSVDINFEPKDRRWWEYIERYDEIRYSSLDGHLSDGCQYTVFMAGKGPDGKFQAKHFAKIPNCQIYIFKDYWHYFSEELQAYGIYDDIIQAAFDGDDRKIQHLIAPLNGHKYCGNAAYN